ncbi:hypothetical protein [Bacillus sp. FJAT-49736]|uniref:hypothetical protein n=1 Tax=Bacillus sp. FJAT-49736 TaxID=2833582 RepID=UPI001BC97CE7|nr:hypothetical protein [Bacillus sp. FJAT-49736]MBS4174254.1 hypothetical protein [Bacillus sp. FJAT-49736]
MRKMWLVLLLLLTLSGCTNTTTTHIAIDWVDFIKWNGKIYKGIYTKVLSDEKYLGKKIGEVKFKVADNIDDPNYQIKDGDAAFHKKGTPIYSIEGNPQSLAVKDSNVVHGYRVYSVRTSLHFKDLPLSKVNRIEIYKGIESPDGPKRTKEIKESDIIKRFLHILSNGSEQPNFSPNTDKGDPISYDMVFYTDESIAYNFWLQYDGVHYFWAPWDTNILSNEIEEFINI